MFIAIVLTVILSTVALAGTVRALHTDGYGRVPTDHTRLP